MGAPNKKEKYAKNEPRFTFNWLFFKRTYNLSKIVFAGWCSLTSVLFMLLMAIAILEQYLIYNVGLISSKYYGVLGSRDYNGFWITTRNSLLYILALTFVMTNKKYVCNILYLSWRELLCKAIHREYFLKMRYYQINVMDDTIDNPDQRITQDVDKMCNTWSQIISIIIISPFTIAYYTYAAYSSTGFAGPTGVYIYFILATVVNKLLMSPIVHIVAKQEKLEGNLRFKHMQIRSNAESLAFLGGGPVECMKTNEKLQALILQQMKLTNYQYPLNLFTNIFDYVGSIVSYLIIAIPIFSGKYDDKTATELSSIVSETSFVCMYLVNCFSQLVDQAINVTNIAGTTHRVAQLIEEMVREPDDSQDLLQNFDNGSDSFNQDQKLYQSPATSSTEYDNPSWTKEDCMFMLSEVTYCTPKANKLLMNDLNLVVKLGTNVLITGSSSSGKSSLLRVLHGLWPHSSGTVQHYTNFYPTEVMHLPQKPYLTDGTLRQQIVFPLLEDTDNLRSLSKEDESLVALLHLANLGQLLDRIGSLDIIPDWNWYDACTPGEIQRLSFVRLFYNKPKLAFLDEAASAVDLELEAVLYKYCIELGITLVSAGHRESLYQFHDAVLHLDGKGGWTWTKLNSKSKQSADSVEDFE